MTRIIVVCFLILFTTSPSIAYAQSTFEQAQEAFQSHQYNEAQILLKNILQDEPTNQSAKLLFIRVLLAQGDGHLAEAELDDARNLGLDLKQLLLLYADAYIAQGKYNQALAMLEDQKLPNIPQDQVLVKKGLAQLGLSHFAVAKQSFNLALNVNPNNIDAKLGSAQVLVIEHKYEQALDELLQITSGYLAPIKAWSMLGSVYLELNQNDLALDAINKALDENPKHISSLLTRASIYIEQSKLELADDDLENILNQFPFEARAVFLKAVVATQSNREDITENTFNEVTEIIKHMPAEYLRQYPYYYYLAAQTFFIQGELSLAEGYINSYLNIDENNLRALLLSANISIRSKDLFSAQSTLNKANLLHPDNTQVLMMLGALNLEMKNPEKAIFYFNQAKSLSPDNPQIDAQYARALIASSNFDQAETELLASIGSNTNSQIAISLNDLLIFTYIKQNQIDKAIALSEDSIKQSPKSAELQFQHGLLLEAAGDLPNALMYFNSAIVFDPRFTQATIAKSRILFKQGQADNAIALLSKALEQHSENAELMLAVAEAYRNKRQYTESLIWYEKAYATAPNDFKVLESYIFMLVMLNQGENAQQALEKYKANNALDYQLILLGGELYRFNGDLNKSIEEYQKAFKLTLSDIEKSKINHLMAKVYSQDNQISEAASRFTKAVAWHTNESLILDFAHFYIAIGRPTAAKELIESQLAAIGTKNVRLLYGQTLLSTQNFSEALTTFKQIDNSNIRAQVGVAKAYVGIGEQQKAKRYLQAAIKQSPNERLLLMMQTEIAIAEKDWQQAAEIYNKLTTLHPSPMVFNNAAYIAIQQENYAQAKIWAEQSVKLYGNEPDSLDTLGLALYYLTEYEKALPHFRKAISLDNNRADIKFHLAQTLIALNRKREGMRLLAESVNSNIPFEEKSAAKSLLESLIE